MVALILGASAACHADPSALTLPLKQIVDVPLGKPTSRYDYESIDSKLGLLFIADLAESRVLVVDVRANKLVKTIPDVANVHGVIAVPEQGRAYATATGANQTVIIDATTLRVIARVSSGGYPDGLAWMPERNKVYVSDEHGQTVAVIDAAANKLLKLIPIGGNVGNTQFNRADGLIYSNDQSHNDLVAIDPAKDAVVGRWKWQTCKGSHGLQLVPDLQIAYAACEGNDKLATMSLADHKQIDVQSVAADPDVMATDFGLKRLYVAGEGGVVSVFDIAHPIPRKIGEAKLSDNAHVVAVDQTTHRVYFPLRNVNVNGAPVLRVMVSTK